MLKNLFCAGMITTFASTNVFAASSGDDFYRSKVIRIIVGFSAGGGFDTYARTLSRYMGKYISGTRRSSLRT
jgi:tripartite-type tricarboxylate transporter receptor subunit TctC